MFRFTVIEAPHSHPIHSLREAGTEEKSGSCQGRQIVARKRNKTEIWRACR